SGLPEPVVAALQKLGKGVRVQLARRREPGPGVKLFLADPRGLHALTLERAEDLLALDLDAWLRGGEAPGAREEQPLYLVCVHGKRDRCCALLGLPVYKALQERVGDRALETTHLGGHRFAATLLVLPHGVCYGRVEADEVPALIDASERGEWFDLARARGRCAYGSEAQAAEITLRQRTGELALSTYTLDGVERGAEGFIVRFDQGAHEVTLQRESLPAMATSCDGDPKPVKKLVASLRF
ncbi:MAG TPA: sucrase ferredoxin, partial [Polyangiales bacterium]|nr:sucrase ferredoxin [Polyangiales bacterium]